MDRFKGAVGGAFAGAYGALHSSMDRFKASENNIIYVV